MAMAINMTTKKMRPASDGLPETGRRNVLIGIYNNAHMTRFASFRKPGKDEATDARSIAVF